MGEAISNFCRVFGCLVLVGLVVIQGYPYVANWVGSDPARRVHEVLVNGSLLPGKAYVAKRVQVIEGHVFDVYLENGKRYLVALNEVVGTPTDAKSAVVAHLNKSRENGNPFIIVPRKWDEANQQWLVDCYTDFNHSNSLREWLVTESLLYSR